MKDSLSENCQFSRHEMSIVLNGKSNEWCTTVYCLFAGNSTSPLQLFFSAFSSRREALLSHTLFLPSRFFPLPLCLHQKFGSRTHKTVHFLCAEGWAPKSKASNEAARRWEIFNAGFRNVGFLYDSSHVRSTALPVGMMDRWLFTLLSADYLQFFLHLI